MGDSIDDREGRILQTVLIYRRFAKLLDKRNRGRIARGESLMRFDPYNGQGRVLVELGRNEGIAQARLAELLSISPQTL